MMRSAASPCWPLLGAALLSVLTTGSGCESPQPRPQVPTTPPISSPSVILIRVAVHLAPGDTIGNRANLGCRLTQSEIQSYLLELEAFAKQKFGVGVDLQWNSPPQVFEDDFLLGRPVFRVQAFLDGVRYNDPGYTHSKLNIYFAGWILPQNPAHPQNSLLCVSAGSNYSTDFFSVRHPYTRGGPFGAGGYDRQPS